MEPIEQQEHYHPPSTAGRSDANIALFLGLYLLILAFFILLVSISSFEDIKSRAVIQSVTSTFSNLLPTTQRPQSFTGDAADVIAGKGFHQTIEGVFAASIQVESTRIIHPGRHMMLASRAGGFFETDSAVLRPTLVPTLDRVVAALSRRPRGLLFRLEFVVRTQAGRGGDLPLGQTLDMARAGAFARAMKARGAPPDSVAVALREGKQGLVELHFLVYPQEDAPYDFLRPADKPDEESP